ncbi:uncharacterized protein FOMMEDRAFT_34037, partial [Fomitiporia mediterranea MF3/22]|uniref:uncharacterized protein n=1 Tax=Fomitiporia mediterranea (strain MF3/22) TaxID=694068 RepID=UPI000440938E
VLPLILYSDSMHLANFGSVSLWPIYMYFRGQSKYMHLFTLIKLPALVQDTYNKVYEQSASSELLTHLKCKLFQAVLSHILLQPEILKAY